MTRDRFDEGMLYFVKFSQQRWVSYPINTHIFYLTPLHVHSIGEVLAV